MPSEPNAHRNLPTSSDVKGTLPQPRPAESGPSGAEPESPVGTVEWRDSLGCIISGLFFGLMVGFLGVLGLSLTGFLESAPRRPPRTVITQEPTQPEVVAQPEFPMLVPGEVYQVERATSLASDYLGEPVQTLPEGGYLRAGEATPDGPIPWYVVYVSDGIQTYPMWIDPAWLKNQRLIRVPTPPS